MEYLGVTDLSDSSPLLAVRLIFLKKKKQEKLSLPFIGFLQALGLVLYCCLVGLFIWRSNKLFGPPYYFLGPALFFALFVVSAMISALMVLGYPFYLFWEKKQTNEALKLVFHTIGWTIFFILVIIFLLIVF